MSTWTLWTEIALYRVIRTCYTMKNVLSKFSSLVVEICLTTGPLAPGPPSVPVGPYEFENTLVTSFVHQRKDWFIKHGCHICRILIRP